MIRAATDLTASGVTLFHGLGSAGCSWRNEAILIIGSSDEMAMSHDDIGEVSATLKFKSVMEFVD